MNTLTYSAARSNLATTIETVCRDHVPVMITKKRNNTVVMISLDDFESMEATAYLLKSPRNAKRLFNSLKSMQTGNVIKKDLAELINA